MKFSLVILLFIVLISCKHNDKIKFIVDSDGYTRQGKVINDSLFHGKVDIYNKDLYVGYTHYLFGIENGESAIFYSNRIIYQKVQYLNGKIHGYAYEYDKNGRLIRKTYFYHGKQVGPIYDYSENNNCVTYWFYGFEGNLLYSSKNDCDGYFKLGEPINLRVSKDKKASNLFLYLVYPNYLKVRYELAILDSSNHIQHSETIDSNNICFYERELKPLNGKKQYAVIQYVYNPSKGKDDLIICKLSDSDVYGFKDLN